MIKSMTGYGHAKVTTDEIHVTFEIKGVNHRLFECSTRAPRNYGFLDEKLKSFLKGKIARGKLECFVQIETEDQENVLVTLNKSLVKGYMNAFEELENHFGIKNDITATTFLSVNEVFSVHKQAEDEERILKAVYAAAKQAVEKFIKMREVEGSKLQKDIRTHMVEIKRNLEFVEARSPETVKEYHAKIKARMKELTEDAKVDEQRIITEAAIFADKVAIDEETVRLHSHLAQLEELFNAQEPIGRKMDFLVQEINREANTIGSKSQDVDIARCVVNIKSEIEKIREQLQNIE